MIKLTEYQVTKPKAECFVITSPHGEFISTGGSVWWKRVGNLVEVIPAEDEEYLAKLLHGHVVLERIRGDQ